MGGADRQVVLTSPAPPAPSETRAGSVVRADVERARLAARLLDNLVRVPGTDVRVGLDPVLGLVPGLGDALGAALSAYIVLLGARNGAPRSVLLRMLANLAADSVLGAVPLLGDLFDAGYKSNVRNVALLERHLEHPARARRGGRIFVAAVALAVAAVLVGAVALAIVLARWLASAIA